MDTITRTNSTQNNQVEGIGSGSPLRSLRRFVQQRQALPANSAAPVEHCDLCKTPLPGEHHHLLDLSGQRILCACQACALLFDAENTFSAKYRVVPGRYLSLSDFTMTDEQWDALMIP